MNDKKSRKDKKDDNNKKISVLRVILVSFLVLFIAGAAIGLGIVFGVIKNTPPIDPNNLEAMLDESSYIYDDKGALIEKVHGDSNRTIVELDQIPLDLQHAVVAIEDERFYKHNGIDIKRLFGALWHDIKTMSLSQGASTITQQLAKNIYTSSEKTITRKIKDNYYAYQLEKSLTKDEILRAYLNTIYLGRGATGVQAAAQTYFSKDVSDLNLAECAMIAGITKYPSKYSPFNTARLDGSENLDEIKDLLVFYPKTPNSEPASEVEKSMFKKLYNKGYIDSYQYNDLMNEQIIVRKAVLNPYSKERQEVVLGKMLELGYIDNTQYEEAKNAPINLKIPRQSTNGISSYFVDLIKDNVVDTLVQQGHTEDEARDVLYNGGLRIYSTMDMQMQQILEKEYENTSNFPGTFKDKNGNIQPQSAMVIMDYHTGEIKSLVGGRMTSGTKLYNRAVNPRQPGSAIKPISVYLPALDNNLTAATPIDDTQSAVRPTNGGWVPKNVGNRYRGPITLRDSVKYSSNVGAVETAQMLGNSDAASIEIMIDYLEDLGITSIVKTPGANDKNYPALTLGGMTKGISPLEMTAAYGAVANDGVYIKPRVITRVETRDGKVLIDDKKSQHRVVPAEVAYIMTDILEDVVNGGTGTRAKLPNMPVAGKTGTTSNNRDAWFVGYSPYYVAATWVGNDMNQPLAQGSAISASLWNKVMSKVHKDLDRKSFEQPDGIVQKSICTTTGSLATNYCPSTRTEIFVDATEPQSYCKLHTHTEEPIIDDTETDDNSPTDIIDKWLNGDNTDDTGDTNTDTNNNSNDNTVITPPTPKPPKPDIPSDNTSGDVIEIKPENTAKP